MNFFSFALGGVDFDRSVHNRRSYGNDFCKAEGESSFKYEGTLSSPTTSGNISTYTIDGTLKVSVLEENFRKTECNLWKGLSNKNSALGFYAVVVDIGVLAAGSLGAVTVAPVVATAVVVSAVAIFSFLRMSQADKQVDQWRDRLQEFVEARKECAPNKGGVGYAISHYENGIKTANSFVTLGETKNIWFGTIEEMKRSLKTTTNKASYVDNFFARGNPFSRSICKKLFRGQLDGICDPTKTEEVFDGDILKNAIQQFYDVQVIYEGLKTGFRMARMNVENSRDELIRFNENIRRGLIRPIEAAYRDLSNKNEYDHGLNTGRSKLPADVDKANSDYNRRKVELRKQRDRYLDPINIYCDERKAEIQRNAEKKIVNINSCERQKLVEFLPIIRSIFERYDSAKAEDVTVTSPPAYNAYNAFDVPEPSAPPMEEGWDSVAAFVKFPKDATDPAFSKKISEHWKP